MGTIVGIGGGELRLRETLAIDKEIVRLAKKPRPKALFIPTASGDAEGYWQTFKDIYGCVLGCDTSVLRISRVALTPQEIERAVFSSDLVYVGGGNTLKMMRRWRALGLSDILKSAFDRGVLLTGISAGAICWFGKGHSDSLSFYNPLSWRYIAVTGLGLVDATLCPHYDQTEDGRSRRESFHSHITRRGGTGIALDNNCAIVVNDDRFRIITSASGSSAYRVYRRRGEVIEDELPQGTWMSWSDNV